MKRVSRFVLTFFLAYVAALGIGHAEDSLGSIQVAVEDFYSGNPISGAQILIAPGDYNGVSDSGGEATFSSITPHRNYQVEVSADGYVDRSAGFVSVEPGAVAEAVVPMKQEASVSGKVTWVNSWLRWLKVPLRSGLVVLGYTENIIGVDIFKVTKVARCDRRGNYLFDGLDEGSYELMALADGFVQVGPVEIDVEAGGTHSQDFGLSRGRGSQVTADILLTDKSREEIAPVIDVPRRVILSGAGSVGAQSLYWIVEQAPEGALVDGDVFVATEYNVVIPAIGDYTFRLVAVDENGVTDSATIDIEGTNVAPEAVASVIPGPSELPLLYDGERYATTSGSTHVMAGETVYLRGLGIDTNLLSPMEYNPGAPGFDVYENKNGNFGASAFTYAWTLEDDEDGDMTSSLSPSAAAQNVSFQIPAGAELGDTFTATLTVTDDLQTQSQPEAVTISVAQEVDESQCAGCHSSQATGHGATAHASEGGATCQDCHGAGSVHVQEGDSNKLTVSNWSGTCGQCHDEFAETQKANHSDPLPFGYFEPTEGRLTTCYRCHYTQGYIGALESGEEFHDFRYDDDALETIPKDSPNISCSICHDPHGADEGNPYGLRTGSTGTACDTCHYEKWHNAILEGLARRFGNGYHYPDKDYSVYRGEGNPHLGEDKCAGCHMSRAIATTDAQGVRKVGGHTLRMRDFGADDILGTEDDLLNLTPCEGCHAGITDFDRNGVQEEMKSLLGELSDLLKGANHDFLPPNEPGSCARCHKGGTVPFDDDPDKVLERAYTNYKLILHDRSYGIHNPGYVKALLNDSIDSVEDYQPSSP